MAKNKQKFCKKSKKVLKNFSLSLEKVNKIVYYIYIGKNDLGGILR